MSHIRLFIALPVADTVKEELRKVQHELRGRFRDEYVRWVKPEQMHLTLRFLGNVETERAAALTEAVREACQGFAPLRLRAEGVGCFPSLRFSRVVWVGVREERDQLQPLQTAVNRAASPFAEREEEKEFAAHLTLGRVKQTKPAQGRILAEAVQGMTTRTFGEWPVDAVELIQSELSTEGSKYTTLALLPLSAQ